MTDTARSRAFRNVTGDPGDPVSTWPTEALEDTITTGLISDWRPVIAEMRRRPWGSVSRRVEQICQRLPDDRAARFFALAVAAIRHHMQEREREDVARRVRAAITRSGLTQAAFARDIGSSASRLSTYASGQVTPSAAMLLRIERTAEHLQPCAGT